MAGTSRVLRDALFSMRLLVDTVEQAIERSGSSENKGAEAAESTIQMISLIDKL